MTPLDYFAEERDRARELGDPWADLCAVATQDDGVPCVRTLVLRTLQEATLGLFVNRTSPKWAALASGSPFQAMTFLSTLNVQYRLTAIGRPLPSETVAESWVLRPTAPKRMDWFYGAVQPQSSEMDSRAALLDALGANVPPAPDAAPDTAAGVLVSVQVLERLDLTQANGVHDRRRYTRTSSGWHEKVLVP